MRVLVAAVFVTTWDAQRDSAKQTGCSINCFGSSESMVADTDFDLLGDAPVKNFRGFRLTSSRSELLQGQ